MGSDLVFSGFWFFDWFLGHGAVVCWYDLGGWVVGHSNLGGWVVGHGAVIQWSDLVVGVVGHSGAASLMVRWFDLGASMGSWVMVVGGYGWWGRWWRFLFFFFFLLWFVVVGGCG